MAISVPVRLTSQAYQLVERVVMAVSAANCSMVIDHCHLFILRRIGACDRGVS